MSAPKLIYLAGPHVFHRDARSIRDALEQVCEGHGLIGIWPDDSTPLADTPRSQRARQIFAANIERLRTSHGVLADLRPFRGTEPDAGTVFEVGMAFALGKPVVAYGVPPGDYADRVSASAAVSADAAGTLRDGAGMSIENFGLSMNLMLAHAAALRSTADEAAAELARMLGAHN